VSAIVPVEGHVGHHAVAAGSVGCVPRHTTSADDGSDKRAEDYKTLGASVSDPRSVSSPTSQAQATSKDQRRQKQSVPTITAAMPSGETTAAVSR
jgi:hypothetical protein